jgi:hypothetical protein
MPSQPFANTYGLPFDSEGYCLDPETGKRVCGAEKNGGGHGFCKSQPMANHRCYRHGGATPNGIAANNYQGKGYSKYLPQRVLQDYNYALNDPALLELRGEMALIEARMSDVLRQLGTGESGQTWRTVQDAMRELLAALQMQPPDPNAQALALNTLRTTIDRGAGDYALWNELGDLIDRKRKLVESETRRTIAAKQFVTLDKLGLFVDAFQSAVLAEVQDRGTLARIQRRWDNFFGGAGQPALADSEPDADLSG